MHFDVQFLVYDAMLSQTKCSFMFFTVDQLLGSERLCSKISVGRIYGLRLVNIVPK